MSFAFIFRSVIMLVLAAHVFYMYCTARGMRETFGFHVSVSLLACLFALAMLIPLVWAVALPEIPEALTQHILPRRRWRQARCPNCGYDMRGRVGDATPSLCSECGIELREPAPWQVGGRTVRRFVAINLLAWLLGCVAGETWMLMDEHDFRDDVAQRLAAGNNSNWSRARRWPNGSCALVYAFPEGIHATE